MKHSRRTTGRTARTRVGAAVGGVIALTTTVLMVVLAGTASAATAVPLGTAGSFAVLAGQTVTNTGPTVVSGDLGVSPGNAVTGFPPGLVNNGTQHVGDAVAAQAQSDLTNAYNNAAGQPATVNGPVELGGQTLLPGVYRSPTLGLTGNLTLNAQGDPGAVFVFQAGSTLITASNSSVSLINGANACNVFWQVGSSATLGTDTAFLGTILALTSISVQTGASVQGRVLARNGSVTLDSNRIDRTGCAATPAPPPTTTTTPPTTTTTAPPTTTTTTAPPTTTTTAPPTTTTTAPPTTTTTAPPTTTTTAPPTTTTTAPPTTTTTTAPPTTTTTAPPTTTTAPPTTTTTAPPTTTTTAPPTTTTTERPTTRPERPTTTTERPTTRPDRPSTRPERPTTTTEAPRTTTATAPAGDDRGDSGDNGDRGNAGGGGGDNGGGDSGGGDSGGGTADVGTGSDTGYGSGGVTVIPLGHPETGAGGAAHTVDRGLIGLGGIAAAGALVTAAFGFRRRRAAGPGNGSAERAQGE